MDARSRNGVLPALQQSTDRLPFPGTFGLKCRLSRRQATSKSSISVRPGKLIDEDAQARRESDDETRRQKLAARLPGSVAVVARETFKLYVNPSRLHYFTEDGDAISGSEI